MVKRMRNGAKLSQFKVARSPFRTFVILDLLNYLSVRMRNISTKFGDDWSCSTELTTVLSWSKMAVTDFKNSGTMYFLRHRCVRNQKRKIFTKLGDEWSNREEMAIDFLRNTWWWQTSAWIWPLCMFWRHRCVVNRIRNMSTKLGDDWSYS